MNRCYVYVEGNSDQLRAWRRHASLPSHPNALTSEDLYLSALPLLDRVKQELISRGWREITPTAGVEHWALLTPSTALAVLEEEGEGGEDLDEGDPSSSSSAIPPQPTSRIFSIPTNLRALVTNVPRWTHLFNDNTFFRPIEHQEHGIILTSNVDTMLVDVFYLLQLILPGALTLVKERHDERVFSTRTSRPFPPLAWMEEHKAIISPIFGESYYSVLTMRSRDGSTLLDFLDT
ncbi:uncharacterized protein EI90DRAFT_2647887 [Cantharellus anzutake]|uniref:uncharacterized protein n=1 Tax=Cantharellus anzutake TaxID=1750568 RepID=UPI001903F393|nr:uncharacterized protein EI90DRAFT_2647887 [Cantharellus anzutake]KAF8337412.1 hypothetical protein EI90DRAFT_2647887 [Cantharellus anzutake]